MRTLGKEQRMRRKLRSIINYKNAYFLLGVYRQLRTYTERQPRIVHHFVRHSSLEGQEFHCHLVYGVRIPQCGIVSLLPVDNILDVLFDDCIAICKASAAGAYVAMPALASTVVTTLYLKR